MFLKSGSQSDTPVQPKKIQIPVPHFPDSDLVSLEWGPGNLFYFSNYPGYCDGQLGLRNPYMEKSLTERSFDLPKPGEKELGSIQGQIPNAKY